MDQAEPRRFLVSFDVESDSYAAAAGECLTSVAAVPEIEPRLGTLEEVGATDEAGYLGVGADDFAELRAAGGLKRTLCRLAGVKSCRIWPPAAEASLASSTGTIARWRPRPVTPRCVGIGLCRSASPRLVMEKIREKHARSRRYAGMRAWRHHARSGTELGYLPAAGSACRVR